MPYPLFGPPLGISITMLAVSLAALPAFAQGNSIAGQALAATILAALVQLALNPATWVVVLAIVYLKFVKGTSRQARVDAAIKAAYGIVEDLKAKGDLPPFANKPAVALEQLQLLLNSQGLTFNGEIETAARLAWSAMHGQSKVAAPKAAGFSPVSVLCAIAGLGALARLVAGALVIALLLLPGAARAQTAPAIVPIRSIVDHGAPSSESGFSLNAKPETMPLTLDAADTGTGADAPTPPAVCNASRFGGCIGPWVSLAPAVVVVPLAINLRTKVIEAGFQPGLCYGASVHSEAWWGFGGDLCGDIDVGTQTARLSLMASFISGWLRVGWGRGWIGNSNATAPRLLFGIGTAIP